ncbi:MAG: thioredoxin domain-containing protein, partial [Thermodesulfobacteriota bacterium]
MMKRKTLILGAMIIGVLAGASLLYLFYTGKISGQILAHVNEEKITVEQFNQEISKVEEPQREILREDPAAFLEGMIMKTLLLQEAKKQGFSPPVKTYKDVTKESLSPEESLIRDFMEKKFSAPPEVTKEEIQTFYAIFKDQMGGKPLNQITPLIEQFIREGKQQKNVEQFLIELRNAAKVEINQDQLQKIAAKPPELNTEEDLKKSLVSGKPVLVDFGANSCLPCRKLRPTLKEIGKEYSGKTHVLVIDVYKHQNLAREHKIQVLPTLVFFDAKG